MSSPSSRFLLTGEWPDDQRRQYSLLQACFQSFLPSLLSTIIPRLCVTAFTFSLPFLISSTVTFIAKSDSISDDNYGRGLIGAWALVCVGLAVSALYHAGEKGRKPIAKIRYRVPSTNIRTSDSSLEFAAASQRLFTIEPYKHGPQIWERSQPFLW